MKAAEDFLLFLHAQVIYATEIVRKTPTTANITELAKLVIEKFTYISREYTRQLYLFRIAV